MDDNDGQKKIGGLGGLKLPDICLTDEEKPRKNLTQETCPDRGSNPGPLRDKRARNKNVVSGTISDIHNITITKSLAKQKRETENDKICSPKIRSSKFIAAQKFANRLL